jgi:hypothetical protein
VSLWWTFKQRTWATNLFEERFGGHVSTTKQLPSELAQLPFLTLEQCAQLLQVSTEHVRRQARAGTLPGLENVLGVYRVRASALLDGVS